MKRWIAYHVLRPQHTQYAMPLLVCLFLCVSCSSPAQPTRTNVPSNVPTAPPTNAPTPLPSLTPARTPAAGGLYVDAGQALGAISPLVFGTNYGPTLFVPLQMQPAAEEARLTVLRFPGGNWGDLNDIESWQLDQFVAFARQIDAQANIHVRLRDGTARQAADLVRLANVEKNYGVRYWTIGNEPNLFGDGYDVARFNQEWREWAVAMQAVDPSIQFIGPEVNQFFASPTDDYQRELVNWVVEFLKANGDMVDVVSFHRYPFPKSINAGPPTLDEMRTNSREWDSLIPALRALVREHAGRDLPIAVTEANSSWAATSGGETTLDSHYNAIWWGDSLGRMIRQGVFMVNQYGITGEFGLMGNYEVLPIYNVYLMYRRFGDTLLYAASDDPDVSIFAARDQSGAVTLMIVNLASSEARLPLTVDNFTPAAPAETWLFDKQHTVEKVEPTPFDRPITLPPESMTLLVASNP
jgi:hypothetical protein